MRKIPNAELEIVTRQVTPIKAENVKVESLTRQVFRWGLISASKSTSMSMFAGGGIPIEIGGGSAASGGRLAADDMARRSRRLSKGRSSPRAASGICCSAPVHDFTLLRPSFPCHISRTIISLTSVEHQPCHMFHLARMSCHATKACIKQRGKS